MHELKILLGISWEDVMTIIMYFFWGHKVLQIHVKKSPINDADIDEVLV